MRKDRRRHTASQTFSRILAEDGNQMERSLINLIMNEHRSKALNCKTDGAMRYGIENTHELLYYNLGIKLDWEHIENCK